MHALSALDPIAKVLGSSSQGIGASAVLFRMVLSVILATLIGCERSSKRHSAGLRTFLLIFLASTAVMELELYLNSVYLLSASVVIAAAIISVNSLVYDSRNKIRGLTTAAGLWTCAITGLCVGAGFYMAALCLFIMMLPSLALLTRFETYLKNRSNYFEIQLELKNSRYLQDFVSVIRQLGLRIDDLEANPAYHGSGLSVYAVALSIHSEELRKYKTHREIIEALGSLEYVSFIEEISS